MDSADLMFYGAVAALAAVAITFLLTGAFQPVAWPESASAFIFGQGWWRLWHALLLLALLGFAAGLVVAAALSADEIYVAFILLTGTLATLLLMTLVDGVLWSTTLYQSGWAKYLAAPALVVVGWAALLVLVLVYNQVLAYFVVDGVAGPGALVLAAAAMVFVNLLALHLYRH